MDTIIVNGVTWPVPSVGGLKVDNKYLLADAERTQQGMHFERLGEVWTIEVTYPSLTQAEYAQIYNSLSTFQVSVTFPNPFTGGNTTTSFYRGDLSITRRWRHLHEPMTITLIGTEII